jgi:hypothetical protein
VWFFCLGGAALATHARRSDRSRPSPEVGTRVVVGLLVLIGAVSPTLIYLSQNQLDDAADAFEAGDCPRAMDRAAASIRTLEVRPEPYEVLGLCDVRLGFDRLGVAGLGRAVERDPDNWEFWYGYAVVRGSAGLDPRAAARTARRRNPHEVLTQSLVRYVDTDRRRRWIARTRPIARRERLSVVD